MPLPFQPKPLDADAAAYIARSGATDRNAINAFVRGVKALGLWNNMVCWPLRSSQNAGTGDTVYSLGGLGTFNGTRVNGPTWGADGLTVLASASQSITIGDDANLKRPDKVALMLTWSTADTSNFTNFGTLLGKTPSGGAQLHNYHFQENSGSRTISFACGDGVAGSTFQSATVGANTSKHCAIGSCIAGGQTKLKFDSGAIASGSNALTQLATSNANLRFMAGNFGSRGGEFAFGALLTTDLSDGQIDSLYTLYKSTLGTGLGLP